MSGTVEATTRPSPWADGRARVFDAALTAALLLPVLFFPLTSVGRMVTLLSFVQIVPLVLRRVQPVACFFVVAAAMALQVFLLDGPIWGQVALPVAAYAVAAYEEWSTARIALGVGLLGAVAGPLDWLHADDALSAGSLTLWFCATAFLVVTPWSLGVLASIRRQQAAERAAREQALEREEARAAELAAAEQRAHVAEQMHDTVTHGLSVILTQAEGAAPTATAQPETAARTLHTIADTAQASLAEMRGMLATLRAAGDEAGAAVQPGLDDLGDLLDRARHAGLEVTRELPDPLPEVPGAVGYTGYRLVEEALRNVREHAGADTHVHLALRRIGGDLLLEVLDDGRGATAPPAEDHGADTGPGTGLGAIRERVAVHDGHLECGPRPGGGYQVRARIPLPFQDSLLDRT